MPNYARCPQCNATVPHRADWCSLCHADLRPAPALVPTDTVPAAHGAASRRTARTATSTGSGGRHRRADESAGPGPAVAAPSTPVTSTPAGRHAATTSSVALADDVEALVADAPVDADGRPDLDVLTSQLMARLQTAESRSTAIPDLDAVPGGKWGVLIGGMVAIATVLVLIMAAAGKLLG